MNDNKKLNIKEEKSNISDKKLENNHNKFLYEIKREKEINLNLKNFSNTLQNIFNEIKMTTKEYCAKINKIIEKLNIYNNTIDKSSENKIENNICNICKNIVEIITNIFVNFESLNNMKDDYFMSFEQNLQQLELKFQIDIQKWEINKNLYEQVFNTLESDLIKGELFPKENEVDNNEKKNLNNKENPPNNDDITRILSCQNTFMDIHKKLKPQLKEIFGIINIERNLLLKIINSNYHNFLWNLYNVGDRINKKIDEENINKLNFNNAYLLKDIDERINNFFDDDIYKFKFLSKFHVYNESSEIQKNRNNNNLEDRLDEINIENIVEKIKKYNFTFNKENIEKIELIKINKKIKSIIELIINTPDDFNQEKKENLMALLKSSIQNQFLFLKYLNNYRGSGKLQFTITSVKIFCEIFEYVFNFGLNNKAFKLIKLCITLSQTYYHENNEQSNEKEKEIEKIYLLHYIKDWKIFKEKTFWKIYLEGLIEEEQKKLDSNNNTKILQKQTSMTIYSSIFTITKTMIDYCLDIDFITSVNDEAFNKYNISEEQKNIITNFLTVESQKQKSKE